MAKPHEIADAERLSGRAYLEKLMREQGAAPFGVLLGIFLTHVGDGTVTFEAEPSKEHYNPQNVVHGGFAATMLDSALGCAVHSRLKAAMSYTTLELKVNYVRPMTAGTGKVRCTAEIVHFGKRTATAEARLHDAKGKLIAHGSTTCMIFS